MSRALFRKEAVDHQSAKIWGEVTLAVPVSCTLMTGFFVVSLIIIAIFLTFGSYARKEHVPGFLMPRLGVARVLPARAGVIKEVHVTEGQLVEAGAPLLTIGVEQAGENGGGIDTAMLASLRQQRDRLSEEIVLDQRKAEADTKRLEQEIAGLLVDIKAMEQESRLNAERSKIAAEQADAIADLAKRGVVSLYEYKRRQDNALQQQQAVLTFNRSLADKRKELDQRRSDLAQMPLSLDKQRTQIEASIADLDSRIKQTDGQRAYLITAPKAGRVSALQAFAGKTVDPTATLMSIVPEGDRLEAELFVPARAIGLVTPGQTVLVSYASFPYQQFGMARGTVASISQTLLKADASMGPISFEGASYRVTVALDSQTIRANGKDVALQADMQLNADILFDRRSLVAWIFSPLFSAWRQY